MLFTTINPPLVFAVKFTDDMSLPEARRITPGVQIVQPKVAGRQVVLKVTTPARIFEVLRGQWLVKTHRGTVTAMTDAEFISQYKPYDPVKSSPKPTTKKSNAPKTV